MSIHFQVFFFFFLQVLYMCSFLNTTGDTPVGPNVAKLAHFRFLYGLRNSKHQRFIVVWRSGTHIRHLHCYP